MLKTLTTLFSIIRLDDLMGLLFVQALRVSGSVSLQYRLKSFASGAGLHGADYRRRKRRTSGTDARGIIAPTWRFMGSYKWSYISRVTFVITPIGGLISPRRTTHEPPGRPSPSRGGLEYRGLEIGV